MGDLLLIPLAGLASLVAYNNLNKGGEIIHEIILCCCSHPSNLHLHHCHYCTT